METYQDAFHEVMAEFDFDKVLKAMVAVDWEYLDGVPTLERIKERARALFCSTNQWGGVDGYHSVGSGGFTWSQRGKGAPLVLRFTIEEVEHVGRDEACVDG